MSINKRIQSILNHYNLTAGAFAERMGIQKSSVSHLLSGRNKPSFQFLSKLVKAFPEINLNWFITGDGDIFNQPEQNIEYANLKDFEKQAKIPHSNTTKGEPVKIEQKKLADESDSNANTVENIIMIYGDDTFKILKNR